MTTINNCRGRHRLSVILIFQAFLHRLVTAGKKVSHLMLPF